MKKQIANQLTQKNNQRIKEIMNTNFEEVIEYNGERHFHKETKALLLSPTRALSLFVEPQMASIPKMVLEQARVEGTDVMEALQYMWERNVSDLEHVPMLSEKTRLMFYALIQHFINENWKIKAVEKHITNGYWHCYVDCIVRDNHCNLMFVEIKTRSNYEVRLSDKIQLVLNMRIGGVNGIGYLVILNKKEMKCKTYKVKFRDVEKVLNNLFRLLIEFNLNTYLLTNYNLK